MLKEFFPFEYVESVFSIDYAKLYEQGFRGIIFDVDNTLVAHGADSTPHVDALIARIQSVGLKVVMLSDNDAERLERFLANIDCPYVCDAEKPSKRGFLHALELLGVPRAKAVCIGDQVFTDIRGANSCGIPSILVKYIGYDEPGPKGKRRFVEGLILRLYAASSSMCGRLGGIELAPGRQGEKGA